MTTSKKPKLWVYSGVRPSNSAKELAAQPGFFRLRPNRFHKVQKGDMIVNWGVSALLPMPVNFNTPHAVKRATDKLQAFYAMEAAKVSTVDFSEDTDDVLGWCKNGATVIVRNKLTGHSGDGIVVIEKGKVQTLSDLMQYEAPLYTKYVFKDAEYRVHVIGNKVVDTQQKIRDPKVAEPKSWKVRSHGNGFIYARNNIEPSQLRDQIAIAACKAIGLDFGAVDIVVKNGVYYVLEVNTAPGLEGQTVVNYAKAIKEMAFGG